MHNNSLLGYVSEANERKKKQEERGKIFILENPKTKKKENKILYIFFKREQTQR